MEYDHSDITLRQAQEMVDQWIRTWGVRYFSPLTNTACLMEEVGEVARLMARIYGDQSFKPGEDGEKPVAETDNHSINNPSPDNIRALQEHGAALGDELADVLWVTLALANQTGVDLTEALRHNIEKKTSRDALRHKNNPKLQREGEDLQREALQKYDNN